MDLTTLNNSANPAKTNMGGVIAPHEENLTSLCFDLFFYLLGQKYRSYKRWGFKDAQEQDKYWIPPTHPLYMESARPIPNYVFILNFLFYNID